MSWNKNEKDGRRKAGEREEDEVGYGVLASGSFEEFFVIREIL